MKMKKLQLIMLVIISASYNMEAQSNRVPTTSIVERSTTIEQGITTHRIKSGPATNSDANSFFLGVTARAGGIINEIHLPGIGDIIGVETDRFGRAGQSSIRDEAHSDVFNPTQAGNNVDLGRTCVIQTTNTNGVPTKLNVNPFSVSLWTGDGRYDYIENEGNNLGVLPDTGLIEYQFSDTYRRDQGNSDFDMVPESQATETHGDEITSPFVYTGDYENMTGTVVNGSTITAAVVRHTFNYAWSVKIENDKSMRQFVNPLAMTIANGNIDVNGPLAPGPVLKPEHFTTKTLSNNANLLQTTGSTDAFDLSGMISTWSIRWDNAIFDPQWRFTRALDGTWSNAIDRRANNRATFIELNTQIRDLIVVSNRVNGRALSGRALALYRPDTPLNRRSIIGKRGTETIPRYAYDRSIESDIRDSPRRGDTNSSLLGFRRKLDYMLNPSGLKINSFENYRQEYYIIYGTPQEVRVAIDQLDDLVALQNPSNRNVLSNTDIDTKKEIAVYPNPSFNGVFNLSSSTPWKVFTITGALIEEGSGNKIELLNAKKGIYLIKQDNKTHKVVVK